MNTRMIQDEPEDDHPAPFAELPQLPTDQPDRPVEAKS